jgi:radical SAM superfamily enzyme YgiQ (UPF0313 family)
MKRNNLSMINYTSPLYSPPAEADNIILQATLGCSHNRCTFCAMYKSKRFCVRPIEELALEIELLSWHYSDANKVFLADGDVLSLPTEYLAELLRLLKNSFPRISREVAIGKVHFDFLSIKSHTPLLLIASLIFLQC